MITKLAKAKQDKISSNCVIAMNVLTRTKTESDSDLQRIRRQGRRPHQTTLILGP